jgi:hypothetical protein
MDAFDHQMQGMEPLGIGADMGAKIRRGVLVVGTQGLNVGIKATPLVIRIQPQPLHQIKGRLAAPTAKVLPAGTVGRNLAATVAAERLWLGVAV